MSRRDRTEERLEPCLRLPSRSQGQEADVTSRGCKGQPPEPRRPSPDCLTPSLYSSSHANPSSRMSLSHPLFLMLSLIHNHVEEIKNIETYKVTHSPGPDISTINSLVVLTCGALCTMKGNFLYKRTGGGGHSAL